MYVRQHGPLIEISTPAKLNLFLEVLGRRSDGYHEIETLMMPIGLYDSLRVRATCEPDIQLTCGWGQGLQVFSETQPSVYEQLPDADHNLAVRALRRLRDRTGVTQGASVSLTKRIPAAAGLGGASSDAAAALVAGNLVWRLGWSLDQLEELAAELGSDVPFFLRSQPTVCRGRGEQLEIVSAPRRLPVVVVKPPVGLSTAKVYQHCRPADRPRSVESLLQALRRCEPAEIGKHLFNRLQPAAVTLSPWVRNLQERFAGMDCLGHQMSGSGTSYFGICRHVRHAAWVAARLRATGVGAVYHVAA